jgi:hypothetical protein
LIFLGRVYRVLRPDTVWTQRRDLRLLPRCRSDLIDPLDHLSDPGAIDLLAQVLPAG